jgi:hypothetical protein
MIRIAFSAIILSFSFVAFGAPEIVIRYLPSKRTTQVPFTLQDKAQFSHALNRPTQFTPKPMINCDSTVRQMVIGPQNQITMIATQPTRAAGNEDYILGTDTITISFSNLAEYRKYINKELNSFSSLNLDEKKIQDIRRGSELNDKKIILFVSRDANDLTELRIDSPGRGSNILKAYILNHLVTASYQMIRLGLIGKTTDSQYFLRRAYLKKNGMVEVRISESVTVLDATQNKVIELFSADELPVGLPLIFENVSSYDRAQDDPELRLGGVVLSQVSYVDLPLSKCGFVL